MGCVSPLIGVDLGYGESGKKEYKILPRNANMSRYATGYKYFDIPCGHCIGCRESQSIEWSNRLLMESLYHDRCYFVTLTLCPDYAIKVPSSDLSTGEYCDRETLRKKDVQDFIKRLRKNYPNCGIRYYFVGEYGPVTGKAHYHGILFCDIPQDEDLFKLKNPRPSETGQLEYESIELEAIWSHTPNRAKETNIPHVVNQEAVKQGKQPYLLGWCTIAPANYFTMRYVAKYVQKKLGARPEQEFLLENRIPPFSLSSRRPGLGYQYLVDHPEMMEDDEMIVGQPQGMVKFQPPRYFKKKTQEFDPGLVDQITDKRVKAASDNWSAKLSRTTLTKQEYEDMQNKVMIDKVALRNKI